MEEASSLPALLVLQARVRPRAVALRHKRLARWHALTWRDALTSVKRLAGALAARGFAPGDALVLLSNHPSPPAILSALAAQWLGGVAVAVDPIAHGKALPLLLEHLEPRFVLVEDEQLLPLLRALTAQWRTPALTFQVDSRGVAAPASSPELRSYESIVGESGPTPATVPDAPWAHGPVAAPDAPAFAFCRLEELSARPGRPEAQQLTHDELLRYGRQLVASEQLAPSEETFASRTFATTAHARYVIAPWLVAGFCLSFPEALATRDGDRREVAPTVLVGTRETYGRLARLVREALPPPRSWSGRLIEWALGSGGDGRLGSLISRWLVRRPLRKLLGFSRTRVPLLVGEPLDAQVEQLFSRLGVRVRNLPDPVDFRATPSLRNGAGHGVSGWRDIAGALLSASGDAE
jgi:long-subunit acyl-CoA synthetase (AMP-forming)